MKYYIIAGEPSGDLHGANLIKGLKAVDSQILVRGWGGDRMAAEGADIVKHYRHLAFMGFAEVAANIRTILSNLSFCKKDILEYKPDVVILIDYPGFNLQVAKFLHKNNIRVVYYISPQVWAWKKNRVHTIRKVVDKLIVILPFEKEFFKQFQVDAVFVGHPLLDELPPPVAAKAFAPDERPVIAMLPGSRRQEIKRVLPVMLSVMQDFPEADFCIAGVPSIGDGFYRKFTGDRHVKVVMNQTYQLLGNARAAMVTSGTATLETALLGVPEVVCYKGGALSYAIARKLVKVKYISLVNLIMDRPVVKELIQTDLNRYNLRGEVSNLLNNAKYRTDMFSAYSELREKLGGRGASARAAQTIYNLLTLPS